MFYFWFCTLACVAERCIVIYLMFDIRYIAVCCALLKLYGTNVWYGITQKTFAKINKYTNKKAKQ